MSRQTEWQHQMRTEGRCITCGRTAARKPDGTHASRCPDCLEAQRAGGGGQRPRRRRWTCPDHPGRRPTKMQGRRGQYVCRVRLVDGATCVRRSGDETIEEARQRIGWRCPEHPEEIPRQANTPGHWYCAKKVWGRNQGEPRYCGISSAAETREEQSERRMATYRERNGGRLPWDQDRPLDEPDALDDWRCPDHPDADPTPSLLGDTKCDERLPDGATCQRRSNPALAEARA